MNNDTQEIEELKKQVLLIAKRSGSLWCIMAYNIGFLIQTGEEIGRYTELWSKKRDDTGKEIELSPAVESVFDIVDKFRSELEAYIKATKVDTADKAMEIAHSFIKKYSPVALPLKAVKEDDVWTVDIDVGALAVKVAKVKVDARTGDILSYDIPQRESQRS